MNDRTETDIKKIDTSFLATVDDNSLDLMQEYRVIPYLKIIQPMTDQEVKDRHGEGSIIMRPGDVPIWKKGDEPIEFIALFFWPEWSTYSDRRDPDNNMVMERSYDPTSAVAKKAKNPATRFEIYPGHEDRPEKDQWVYRNIEHFRFAGIIASGDFEGTEVVLTFERGEHFVGKNFISAITMRKHEGVRVPLWGQVHKLWGTFRERGGNKWYGIDVEPANIPIIDSSSAPELQAMHVKLKEDFVNQRLVVDDKEEKVDEAATEEMCDF